MGKGLSYMTRYRENGYGLCKKLADCISSMDADTVIDGHWVKQTKEEALNDIMTDI